MRLPQHIGLLSLFLVATLPIHAETGAEGWLRYAPLSQTAAANYATLPSQIVVPGNTPTDQAAANELQRGLTSMLGRPFTIAHEARDNTNAILVANLATLNKAFTVSGDKLSPESYTLGEKTEGNTHRYIILGADPRGELYGAFHLLELVASQQPLPTKPATESPSSPIRWLNQWDNLDGTIERGYAGRSIFFDNGHVRPDLTRVHDYGRLLASIGINGVTVNNVNSDLRTLSPDMIREFARIADQLRPWGVRMSLSVDLSSPQSCRWPLHLRPRRPHRHRLVANQSRRDLQSHPRLRRLRHQSGLRRPRRPFAISPHSRRSRQHRSPRPQTPRRPRPLPRLRLQQPPRLQRPQSRPRPRRLRQLPRPRRQVRTQRRHPGEARPHRLPGPRARLAALRRAPAHQPGNRAADHPGVPRPAAPHGLPRPHVEDHARHRPPRRQSQHTRKRDRRRQILPPAARRLRRRRQRRPRHQLDASPHGHGQPLRLRQTSLEPQPHHRPDPRHLDPPNLGQQPHRRLHHQRTPAPLLARLRAVHRQPRHRHPHQHPRLPLRPRHRVRRAQRLGPMVPRRRARYRDGPHRSHRHRLHRPIPTRTRQGLRRRQHLPRRSPPLHAPRPLHPRPARRKNRCPVRLRRPLRRRRHRANLRPPLANPPRPHRR